MKPDAPWLDAAFSSAPGGGHRSGTLGFRNPILLEIHTDCGRVSGAVSLALGLVGDLLFDFDKCTENKTQSPPSLVYCSSDLIQLCSLACSVSLLAYDQLGNKAARKLHIMNTNKGINDMLRLKLSLASLKHQQ